MLRPSSYWDKRAIERASIIERNSQPYIDNVKKMYEKAQRDIKRDIENIYLNYSKDTGLDVQKLKTLLSKKETSKFWKTMEGKGLKKYVKNNYKARISRLEMLQGQLYAKAKEIYEYEELQNKFSHHNTVIDSYNRVIYDTQMGTNLNFSFGTLDENTIETLLNENWSGANYSTRIWNNTDILANKLSEILGGAMISGQNPSKTIQEIREAFGTSKYYAERLIRTETNHFNNEAEALAYEDMGLEEYVFVATLDNRTSLMCQSHDNKRYKVSDRQVGVNYPPLHPNCRSTVRPYIGEEAEKNLQRRARNPITGKNEIINNMSYNEWVKQYGLSANIDDNIMEISDKVYNIYKNNGFENLALVNSNTGELIGDISNNKSPSNVGYSMKQKELMKNYNRNLYAIHNHPANHTFSLNDLYETFNNKSLCGIMVRTDEYNYYFIPKKSDIDITRNNLSEFSNWFENRLGKVNDDLLQKYPQKSNNELMHLAYKEIFTQMEWDYGRKKI